MTHVLTGTLRGHTITLDADVPTLADQRALEGRRVRVALEPLADTGEPLAEESARLLKSWSEQGPRGPIEETGGDERPEDPNLVLSAEEQRRLLKAWAEQGPQGPMDL